MGKPSIDNPLEEKLLPTLVSIFLSQHIASVNDSPQKQVYHYPWQFSYAVTS